MFKNSRTILSALAATTLVMALTTPSARAHEPFIGEIRMVGFNFAPVGWAFCNGQNLAIQDNPALFSLLGTTYGGDARTYFTLPDLRGRTAVHPGQGVGLTLVQLGQKGGAETGILSIANLPEHSHTATATLYGTSTDGNQTGPAGHILANDPREDQYSDETPNVTMDAATVTVSVGNAGNGQSFGVRNPYLGIYHCIALVGVFPSRN